MGEDLGSHGELESWSDLKLLDLTFNFLSGQQGHQGQGLWGTRLHVVPLPEVFPSENF